MKRSALFHCHRRLGAQFFNIDGWEVPASFGSEEEEVAHVRAYLGITDISHAATINASLLLAGPRSTEVLSKLTSLRLSGIAKAQTNLAHVHATIVREQLGDIPAYQILIQRDCAESVWESILHAGEEFHVKPFGFLALTALKG